VLVQPASEIVQTVQALGIKIGIVAVPAASAQSVTDKFVDGGVRAILNYAPVTLKTPEHVWVREIDPTGAMQSMTYYLERDDLSHDDSPSDAPARRVAAQAYDAANGS
jgi:redox-sensing transcriptional repressor